MKAVLDTNVVVSGIFFGGIPRSLLEAWAAGAFELMLTPNIFSEYRRICERLGEKRPGLTYDAILLRLIGVGTLVPDSPSATEITRDRDDDKFILCGRNVGAIVVSGDRHLLEVSGWEGVEVWTPTAFWNELNKLQ